MQISDNEVRRVLQNVTDRREREALGSPLETEPPVPQEVVLDLVKQVVRMPDREDRVAELRARIEAGEYNPSGYEIAEAMIRRAIADRIR